MFENKHLENSTLFECFDDIHWNKTITLWKGCNKYASLIHSSEVNYTIETKDENSETSFFFLCPINEKKTSTLKINFNINHSWTKLDVHVVALVAENVPVTIDANIIMKEWIQWASASLLEESVILSPSVSIKSLPILDIHAKNIQASHWAKIYRLDNDKLFYLESKWLNKVQAEGLMISSFRERMFDLVQMGEEKRKWIINTFLTFSK